jgi:hypothetical protein
LFKAARALGNVSKGGPDIISQFISLGATSSLKDILESGSADAQEQAARTLDIFSSDVSAVEDMVDKGMHNPIL